MTLWLAVIAVCVWIIERSNAWVPKVIVLIMVAAFVFCVLDWTFGGNPRNWQGPYEG